MYDKKIDDFLKSLDDKDFKNLMISIDGTGKVIIPQYYLKEHISNKIEEEYDDCFINQNFPNQIDDIFDELKDYLESDNPSIQDSIDDVIYSFMNGEFEDVNELLSEKKRESVIIKRDDSIGVIFEAA